MSSRSSSDDPDAEQGAIPGDDGARGVTSPDPAPPALATSPAATSPDPAPPAPGTATDPGTPADRRSTPAVASRGIGSHGGHAGLETAEPVELGNGVVVHRPGYPARRLAPVPGVGLERGRVPLEVLQKEAEARLYVWALGADGAATETRDLTQLRALVAEEGTRVWVDLADPTNALVAEVADALGIHPLVAEDIVEKGQRPKVEITGDGVHLVVYALRYGKSLSTSEIDVVLGRESLLTSHDGQWAPTETHHLRLGPFPLMARGMDYLTWALIDSLVDSYYPIFDGIDAEIETLEDEILETASKASLERLLEVKRSLVDIRHVVSPMREVFNQLTNRELGLVQPETILYFRDVYDHLIRLNDELDSQRELASGILDVYLSTINNNLSLIMKRLTGVTVILAGIGAVGGLFGMSEASAALSGGEHSGFWIITIGVLVGAALVALFLKRIDWI